MSNLNANTNIDQQINDRYMKLRWLTLTHPDEYFRKIVNPFYLIVFMGILIFVYIYLLMVCYSSGQTLLNINRKVVSNEINDLNLHQILTNISNDDNYCFHCVQHHFDPDRLRTLIEKENTHKERDEALKLIRLFFNILLITNCVVVFVVFGGPKLITFLSIFSSSLIFGSIYVDNVIDAVYFESSVMLIAFVVLLKSLYVILVQIIVVEKKKSS